MEQQQEYLRSKGVAEFKPRTGFKDNWLTAMHMNWYEGMSNSRSRVLHGEEYSTN